MTDEDQRLIEEARRSRDATEELRKTGSAPEPPESDRSTEAGNPWAKTSSGDADSITEDD
jgi:hypothetical protein